VISLLSFAGSTLIVGANRYFLMAYAQYIGCKPAFYKIPDLDWQPGTIMAITRDEVINAAKLARIAIDETHIEGYTQDLTRILNLVDQMQAVDTTNIEPMAHPLDAVQRLRTDKITEVDQRDYFQEIAPLTEAGLYLVPQVID